MYTKSSPTTTSSSGNSREVKDFSQSNTNPTLPEESQSALRSLNPVVHVQEEDS